MMRAHQPVAGLHLSLERAITRRSRGGLDALARVRRNLDAQAPHRRSDLASDGDAVLTPVRGVGVQSVVDVHGEYRHIPPDINGCLEGVQQHRGIQSAAERDDVAAGPACQLFEIGEPPAE